MWRSRTNSEVSLRNSKTFWVHAFVMMFFPKKVPGYWRWFFPFTFWFRYSDFCRFEFWRYPSGMIIHSPRCRRQKPCLCRCTKILLLCRIHTRRRETFWRQEMGSAGRVMRRPLWRVDLMPSAAPGHGDLKWAPCGRRMKTLARTPCQHDARQVFLGIGATFEVKAMMRLKVAKLDVLPVVSSPDGWLRQCWRWAIHGSFCCIGLSRTWFLLRFLAFCVTVTIAWCVGIYWRTHQQLQIRIFSKAIACDNTALHVHGLAWLFRTSTLHRLLCPVLMTLWRCFLWKAFVCFAIQVSKYRCNQSWQRNMTWTRFCYALRTFKNSRAGAAGVLIQIWPVSCDLLSLSPQSSSSARRDKL